MSETKLDGEQVAGAYDVVVLGAGIIGSCTAYELAKRGKKVLLLEQFDFLHHRGSSHGESRTIRITYPEDYYTEMMVESYALWDKAQQDSGYAVYTKTGQLDFGPRDNNTGLTSVITSLQKFDIEHEILSREQVSDRFPVVDLPEKWYAVYTAHGGILRASKAVAMFQFLAAKHGATLRDRAKVLKISPHSVNTVSVTTSRGVAIAEKCVIAAGSWTGKFVRELTGIELPITPLHTTLAYWEFDGDEFSHEKGFPVFNSYDIPFIYGTPAIEYPGMIKVAHHSGVPCDPETRTVAPDLGMLNDIVSPWLARIFQGKVKHDAPVIAEGCVYSMTPDEDFILDFLPWGADGGEKKILVAAGFSGHGFKMAPVVGKIMADLATTGNSAGSANWLPHFCLQRFEKNPDGNRKGFQANVVEYTEVLMKLKQDLKI